MQRIFAAVFFVGAVLSALPLRPVTAADVLSSTFPKTAIPDNDPAGLTFDIGTAPTERLVDHITITLSHEWLGDVTLRILPPAGPAFTLFDRLDVTPANPDGSSAILGSIVFDANHEGILVTQPYTFSSAGADFAAEAQNAVNTQDAPIVPSEKTYGAESWPSGPFPEGTWRLFVADSAELSRGLIASVEIAFTPAVPEPSVKALGFLALFMACAVRTLAGKCGSLRLLRT